MLMHETAPDPKLPVTFNADENTAQWLPPLPCLNHDSFLMRESECRNGGDGVGSFDNISTTIHFVV